MAGGRILVVDDDNVLRASISRILEDEGYTVDNAADGASALDIVQANPPDAILLDVMMPGMNGRQFLTELRGTANQQEIPVVVMTALQGLGDRALEYGANDIVEKPFDIDELLNKVALALFRSGEYETLTDRPTGGGGTEVDASAGADQSESARRKGGVVLVVDEDDTSLSKIDAQLAAQGYTVVGMSRATDELPRLARVLEPTAVVLGLRGKMPMALAALRMMRSHDSLTDIPVLVFRGSEQDDIEAYREEIESLRAEAIPRPIGDTDIGEFLP